MIMVIKVVEAIGSETGGKDGTPGDQTGREILLRTFKTRSYAFTQHLTCTDRKMARLAVEYGTRIAACSKFGYSQKSRWTGLKNIEYVGAEQLEQAEPGDFDCSSLVIGCYRLAGCPLQMTGYTGNIADLLTKTGYFKPTTAESAIAGDVWNAPGKHALLITSGGAEPPEPTPEPVKTYILIKGNNVRIRSGASTDYPTIQIAHKGETYPYIKTDPNTGWFWIECDKGKGGITSKARYTEMVNK